MSAYVERCHELRFRLNLMIISLYRVWWRKCAVLQVCTCCNAQHHTAADMSDVANWISSIGTTEEVDIGIASSPHTFLDPATSALLGLSGLHQLAVEAGFVVRECRDET